MSDSKNKKKGKGKATKKEETATTEGNNQETNLIINNQTNQGIGQDQTDLIDTSKEKQQETITQDQEQTSNKGEEAEMDKKDQDSRDDQKGSVQKEIVQSQVDTKQIDLAQPETKQPSLSPSEHPQVSQPVPSQNVQINQIDSTQTQISSTVPSLQSNETGSSKELQNIGQNPLEQTKSGSEVIIQSPQPIILISTTSNVTGSNEDLDAQSSKQTKTSKRLAKFKQKQKKSLPKEQQKSPEHQNVVKAHHSLSQTVSNLKSKFTKPAREVQPVIEKDMDEYKMLLMMIQSKKKQNYRNLKEWDDKRVNELSLHLSIIAGFEKNIDNLARTSFENFEIYINTFKEIYNQQEKFASHPMIDTIYTTKNNTFSQNIYINCSCILNALNEQNIERSKKAKEFAEFIQANILTGILDAHLDNVQDVLTGIKHRLGAMKSVLINTQVELDNKTQKLAKSFSDNILQLEDKKDQDFYESELEFLRIAYSIVGIHKQYAELVLEYYAVIKNIESERANVIKKALKIYSEGLQSIFQSKTGQQSLQQLSKGEEKKLIEQFFSLQELIPLNLQQSIKQKIEVVSDGFLIQHLRQYFRSFEFEKFDLRQLILKQYPITNKTENRQNSALLITVDKFIHIFTTLEGYAQPTASYKIDNLLRIRRKGSELQLESLPEKKGGVLGIFGWSTKGHSSTSIQFLKKDSAEEAEDYIKKLV